MKLTTFNRRLSARFLYLLYRARFLEAVSLIEGDPSVINGLEQWACYRAGLHRRVLQSSPDEKCAFSLFSHIVANAVIGNLVESSHLSQILSRLVWFASCKHRLAAAVAPYHRSLAMDLTYRDYRSVGLRFALKQLLARQQGDCLPVLTQSPLADRVNDGLLLWSNAREFPHAYKLHLLNRHFSKYGLSPVTVKNGCMPINVTNITSNLSYRNVNGPLVSVLITAHNTAEYIGSTLSGLAGQTYKNIEILIADDCSSDETWGVVEYWAKRDHRIHAIKTERNVGTYVAKNQLLGMANGEFAMCHDSDDWSHPMRIELQIRPLLGCERFVASTCLWFRVDSSGRYYSRLVYPFTRFNPSSPMFRRALVLERAGYWDSVRTGADSEFYNRLKLIFGRDSVFLVNKPLSIGAHRDNSLMTSEGTGYGETGPCRVRQDYWESWTLWHMRCLVEGTIPRFDFPLKSCRPFAIPPEIGI